MSDGEEIAGESDGTTQFATKSTSEKTRLSATSIVIRGTESAPKTLQLPQQTGQSVVDLPVEGDRALERNSSASNPSVDITPKAAVSAVRATTAPTVAENESSISTLTTLSDRVTPDSGADTSVTQLSSVARAAITTSFSAARVSVAAPVPTTTVVDDALLAGLLNADPSLEYSYTRFLVSLKGQTVTGSYLGDTEYAAFLARNGELYGFSNFSRTSTGSLAYTNTATQPTLVIYGPRADNIFRGAVVVQPGKTVILPAGPAGAAAAQLPSSISTNENPANAYIAVAYIGAPLPRTVTSSAPVGPVTTPVKSSGGGTSRPTAAPVAAKPKPKPATSTAPTKAPSIADTVLAWSQQHPVPTEASLAKDLTDFLVNHVADYAKLMEQLHAKQLFDSLPSWMKNDAFNKIADIADGKVKITPSMAEQIIGPIKFAMRWMAPLGVLSAVVDSSKAHTEAEKTHAAISTVAGWAPFFGAAIGFVVAGPPGALTGWSVGGAAGLGLSIGNGLTTAVGW